MWLISFWLPLKTIQKGYPLLRKHPDLDSKPTQTLQKLRRFPALSSPEARLSPLCSGLVPLVQLIHDQVRNLSETYHLAKSNCQVHFAHI